MPQAQPISPEIQEQPDEEVIENEAENPLESSEDLTAKTELYEIIRQQTTERINNLEATISEPHRLAKALSRTGDVNESTLRHYLEAKKDVFESELTSEQLAGELMFIESSMIAPMIEKLRLAGKDEKQIEAVTLAARETFFGMVLSGRLSAEKIREILDGAIFYSSQPGEEVNEEYKDRENFASYLSFDGSKYNIHIYDKLLDSSTANMAFLFKHEFAHVAALSIWKERYKEFLNASANPHSALQRFNDVPELQQILFLVSNPRLAKNFFRGYIADILEKIETSTNPEEISALRKRAAKEMVADLTAHFLEGSRSADVLGDLRMRYLTKDPQEFMKIICELEGVNSEQELFSKYSIDPETVSPRDLIEKLSSSIPLSGLFRTSKVWQERLQRLFAGRGQNLSRPRFAIEELEGYEEPEFLETVPSIVRPSDQVNETGTSSTVQSVTGALLNIWEIITGRNKAK